MRDEALVLRREVDRSGFAVAGFDYGTTAIPFSHTVGLSTPGGKPELVISGCGEEEAAILLGEAAELHQRHTIVEGPVELAISSRALYAIPAPFLPRDTVVRQVLGRGFQALQLLWADEAGHFPDHQDYDGPQQHVYGSRTRR